MGAWKAFFPKAPFGNGGGGKFFGFPPTQGTLKSPKILGPSLAWEPGKPDFPACSHLVIYLTAIESLLPESGVPAKRLARKGIDEEMLKAYIEKYSNFLGDKLNSSNGIYHWGAKQTYIAMTSMMLASASLGVDSCSNRGV